MTLVADDLRSRPQHMNGPTIPAPRPMPERPPPKAIADLTLVATATAVSVANLFLDYTLKQWGHPRLIDNGEALLSELVGKAVELTGVPDPSARWVDLDDLALVLVRLVLLEHGVILEVADRHDKPPEPSDVFRVLCKRWSFYPTKRGRVVWCELNLPPYEVTEHGLPKRVRPKTTDANRPPVVEIDKELLRRVRGGLEGLR